MSDNHPGFIDLQYQFTAHIRSPETNPAPEGIEDRRMGIYRDLLFNNVEDCLAGNFPVLNEIMPSQEWQAMVREYFAKHQAHNPLFPQMAKEFLRYLEESETNWLERYPFMLELAHYEWIEASLSIDTREIEFQGVDQAGDLLASLPVLSPLVALLSYRYPVHRISPDYQPDQAPEMPTYIVVFRDRDDEVGFIELNPVSAQLLAQIQQDQNRTGREILISIAEEIGHGDPQVVIDGGLQILQQFKQRDIILGTRIA